MLGGHANPSSSCSGGEEIYIFQSVWTALYLLSYKIF
jgi:hypothetical protein